MMIMVMTIITIIIYSLGIIIFRGSRKENNKLITVVINFLIINITVVAVYYLTVEVGSDGFDFILEFDIKETH